MHRILESEAWKASEPHLRGAIALSNHLGEFLSSRLKVPVVAVKHPSQIPDRLWSEESYLRNPQKKLVQLGWHLRNTRAIHQVPKLRDHSKVRCLPRKPWIADYDERLSVYWQARNTRSEHGGVVELGYLSNADYDDHMSNHVVLTELFEASANNVVIECIARNTPLAINRHPAATEYLTPEYPLFFNELEELPDLLTTDRVIAAHRYLRQMDKHWLNGNVFCNSIREALVAMDLERSTRPDPDSIPGWYDPRFNEILQQIDRQQGFGHVGEIGVHYGKSFARLCQLCHRDELALAVDCFDHQQHNRSRSGSGRKDQFLRNVRGLPHVRVIEGDSLTFKANQYRSAVGGPFRIFHVDGGHDAETALHDLTQAACALTDEGVLIVDDVFNPDWPAVSQALYQFLETSELRPFAIAFNKVCLSRRPYVLESPRDVKFWLGAEVRIF